MLGNYIGIRPRRSGDAPPAAPVAAALSSILDVSFTTSISAVTGADKYYIDVNTAADFAGTAILSNYDNGTGLTKSVTGLSENTPYYVRWRAANASGSGVDSNTVTATTYYSKTVTFMTVTAIPDDGTVYFAATAYVNTGHGLWVAANSTIEDLYTYSLMAKAKVFYMLLGTSSTVNKYNAIDPQNTDAAYRITFSGGVVHSGAGVKGSLVNGGADTHYNTSTNQANKYGFALYNTVAPTLSSRAIGCNDGASHYFQMSWNGNGNVYCYGYSGTDTHDTHNGDATGSFIVARQGATARRLKVNARTIVSDSATIGTNPNTTLNFLCNNGNGTKDQFCDHTVGAVYITDDELTDTEITNLREVLRNHNLRLNRAV